MFFSRFFRKNPQQLREQGDSLFNGGHFADARLVYMDAAEKLSLSEPNTEDMAYLRTMISRSTNSLAEHNISEAEESIRSGNYDKAEENLNLSLELADDVTLR